MNDYPRIGRHSPGAPYYIAAAWENLDAVPESFTVGDGSVTMVDGTEYINAPLSPDTSYAFLVRVEIVSDTPQALVTYSEPIVLSTPLGYSPGGVAFGVILIIALIVAIIVGLVVGLWWYR